MLTATLICGAMTMSSCEGLIDAIVGDHVDTPTQTTKPSTDNESMVSQITIDLSKLDGQYLNDDNEIIVLVGDEVSLSFVVLPEAIAETTTVTLESADETIVSIDGTKVKALSAGRTTLTAKAGDKTATCNVIVSDFDAVATPLTVEAIEDGTTITISYNGTTALDQPITYSVNLGEVKSGSPVKDTPIEISLNSGGKLQLHSKNAGLGQKSTNSSDHPHVAVAGDKKFYAYGNVMSMIDDGSDGFAKDLEIAKEMALFGLFKDSENLMNHNIKKLALPATTLSGSCYSAMFDNCVALTDAPVLPATTLTEFCYNGMFSNCKVLKKAPDLPAKTLAKGCYWTMFMGCLALTEAPALPATTLAESCYNGMFYSCEALTIAPTLPATTLAKECYRNMFANCRALTASPELPATSLTEGCYMLMFSGCSALTKASDLPAMTLADRCYSYMFRTCQKLATAPELPATTLAQSCYESMFQNCYALTTAPELPATTLASDCYSHMFNFCKGLTAAPKLPATTLAKSCYQGMFSYCTSLATAPALPATTLAETCYFWMFGECNSLTSAPELPATTLAVSCYETMFSNCSNLREVICHATDISATSSLKNWMEGVSATGDFYKEASMTTMPTGSSGIPEGWTIHSMTD